MAPIIYPAPITEKYNLTGRGSLVLTRDQREAKSFSWTIEKVKSAGEAEYFNFRYPEPQSFWGYVQLMRADFVISTHQLEYRRQSVLFWDNSIAQQILLQNCMIKTLGGLLICAANAILSETSPPPSPGGGETTSPLEQCLPDWIDIRDRPEQIPLAEPTAIWYSVEPGFSAFVTLTYQDYYNQCGDYPAFVPQPQPPAKPPAKDESGTGGAGGGGTRPGEQPPANRVSDPNADSGAPPPIVPQGPPSPTATSGMVRVTTQWLAYSGNGCETISFQGSVDVSINEGTTVGDYGWIITNNIGPQIGCPGDRKEFQLRGATGQPLSDAGPIGVPNAGGGPVVISVESI